MLAKKIEDNDHDDSVVASEEPQFIVGDAVSDDEIENSLHDILKIMQHAEASNDIDDLTSDDVSDLQDDDEDVEPTIDVDDDDEPGLLTLSDLIARQKNDDDDDWVDTSKIDTSGSADPLRIFFREMEKFPLLSAKDEIELALRCQKGDKKAQSLFLSTNLRLVVHVAKKYISSGIPLADLISEGNMGLLEAVERFDPEKGFRFSTYATWWIRQAVQRSVHNHGRTIRVPVHMSQMYRKLLRVEQSMKASGEAVTDEAVASKMELSLEKLQKVREAVTDVLSLDMPTGDDGSNSLMDQAKDEHADAGLSDLIKSGSAGWLSEAMQRLSNKERYVLRCRFGIGLNSEMTLDEIGHSINLTRERIRQIEGIAMRKIRHYFGQKGLFSRDLC